MDGMDKYKEFEKLVDGYNLAVKDQLLKSFYNLKTYTEYLEYLVYKGCYIDTVKGMYGLNFIDPKLNKLYPTKYKETIEEAIMYMVDQIRNYK